MENLKGRWLKTTNKFKPGGVDYLFILEDDPGSNCVETDIWGSTSRQRYEEDGELILMPEGFNPKDTVNNNYITF